jgi:tRNA (guanine37-N1)-methyltransferase
MKVENKTLFSATILTIFPEIFPGPLGISLSGQALRSSIWNCRTIDIKQFGKTKHKNVDDVQYGGGNGLVMRPDVLGGALDEAIKVSGSKILYYLSPRGKPFTQALAHKIVEQKNIIILCGRFEGIDERVIDEYNAEEITIGDFVLSGGETAALTMLDACVRLVPGVVANQETLLEESFCTQGMLKGLLEYPLYTRPVVWNGRSVPDVLISGDHAKIQEWRIKQAEIVTKLGRPDIWKKYTEI